MLNAAMLAIAAAFGVYLVTRGQLGASAPASAPADPLPWGGDAAPSADSVPSDAVDQLPTMYQSAAIALDPTSWGVFTPQATPSEDANVRAFLDMLAYSEGTAGPDGYRTMFGGQLCDSYADHPRRVFSFTNSRGQTLTTSAAGRYQFLARTWDALKAKLGLPDFSPDSQDAAAIELIRERGALADVRAGRIAQAIAKCAPTWASLPGAGYAQPERSLDSLMASYSGAGGITNEG